jgi:hypothetical protein
VAYEAKDYRSKPHRQSRATIRGLAKMHDVRDLANKLGEATADDASTKSSVCNTGTNASDDDSDETMRIQLTNKPPQNRSLCAEGERLTPSSVIALFGIGISSNTYRRFRDEVHRRWGDIQTLDLRNAGDRELFVCAVARWDFRKSALEPLLKARCDYVASMALGNDGHQATKYLLYQLLVAMKRSQPKVPNGLKRLQEEIDELKAKTAHTSRKVDSEAKTWRAENRKLRTQTEHQLREHTQQISQLQHHNDARLDRERNLRHDMEEMILQETTAIHTALANQNETINRKLELQGNDIDNKLHKQQIHIDGKFAQIGIDVRETLNEKFQELFNKMQITDHEKQNNQSPAEELSTPNTRKPLILCCMPLASRRSQMAAFNWTEISGPRDEAAAARIALAVARAFADGYRSGEASGLFFAVGQSGTGKSKCTRACVVECVVLLVMDRHRQLDDVPLDLTITRVSEVDIQGKEIGLGCFHLLSRQGRDVEGTVRSWLKGCLDEEQRKADVQATAMNQNSSRSHTIFKISILGATFIFVDTIGIENRSTLSDDSVANSQRGALQKSTVPMGMFVKGLIKGFCGGKEFGEVNSHKSRLGTFLAKQILPGEMPTLAVYLGIHHSAAPARADSLYDQFIGSGY